MEEDIKYVRNSKNRTKVMKSLDGHAKMPFEIADDEKISKKHISEILKQLSSHDLVLCINPEMRKGKIYRLTEKGERIVGDI